MASDGVHPTVLHALVLSVSVIGGRAVAGDGCEPEWLPAFGNPGIGGYIAALASYDDGNGPLLYQGGNGIHFSANMASWNGSSWSPLDSQVNGVGGTVNAMILHDDGNGAGPSLFVAGNISTAAGMPAENIMRWDGSSMSALGSGVSSAVHALAVFDDGRGPALYAGGEFWSAGGLDDADNLARWDGSTWSTVGNVVGANAGPDFYVYALAVYDDGSGPALYAGGTFLAVDGIGANRIARWDGSSWSAVGAGISGGTSPSVNAMAVYDDGSGPTLYVAGRFTNAGGVSANNIAKWNGSTWSALGSGVSGAGTFPLVRALIVHDDGSGAGEALYAGGLFTSAGGAPASRLARWDGSSWSALPSEVNGAVVCFAQHDDGSGSALYAGGSFTTAGGSIANKIARWDGSTWSNLGSGIAERVWSVAAFDDGSGDGPAFYAGGDFEIAGDVFANYIARWDGSSWSPLGSGSSYDVEVMEVFDDGSGPALYVGGPASNIGGIPQADRIARWDGSSWSALGTGLSNSGADAMVVYDPPGGLGPALYVGGNFNSASGLPVNHIARWDGTSWSALGTGMEDWVWALAVHDGDLYAGGVFTSAGGVPANYVARWDGSNWSALGSGMDDLVHSLAVFDDGSGGGPALYAGGNFVTAGGVTVNRIARWDGTQWSALGSGLGGGNVLAMEVYDDGSGPALYIGGGFSTVDGVDAQRIARWDGSSWSSLESGIGSNSWVYDMVVLDGDLYVGGEFANSASGDSNVARFRCAEESNPYDFTGDGVVGFADLVEVLLHWGSCPDPCAPATCQCDVDGSCDVGFGDLTLVLVNWG